MRYPQPLSEFIPWSTAHAELWVSDPGAVGMTAQQAESVRAAAEAAKAAWLAAEAARQASLNATAAQEQAERALRRAVQNAVVLIDVCAEGSPSPASVYSAALLPAPTAPRAVPAPGKVRALAATLEPITGATVLRWKGNNPRGGGSVTYMVYRRLPGEGAFQWIGTAPPSGPKRRMFIDGSLPVGTGSVRYLVRAVRGAKEGEAAEISVQFGSVAGEGGRGEGGKDVEGVKRAA